LAADERPAAGPASAGPARPRPTEAARASRAGRAALVRGPPLRGAAAAPPPAGPDVRDEHTRVRDLARRLRARLRARGALDDGLRRERRPREAAARGGALRLLHREARGLDRTVRLVRRRDASRHRRREAWLLARARRP